MNDATSTFHQLRPRLQGIAYRMLSSLAEAEDLVQDVWLRWHEAEQDAIHNAEAWLVTTTTRLSIDRLRAAKVQRESYFGFWLPEPVLSASPATPEQVKELSDDVPVAFLMLLERLTPEARAAFLLREGQPRYAVSRDTHQHLLRRFAQAMASGDFAALNAMLAEGAELIGDGGGIVPSFGQALLGGQRIAQLFYAAVLRFGQAGVRVEMAVVNGEWALLRFINGELESVQSYETDGERILRIHVQRNPHKLARLAGMLDPSSATGSP